MAFNLAERIEKLSAAVQPVVAEDHIAEAGRKILLNEFVKILQREAGSRTGEDVEDVHQMRVAIRKTRSLLRLLKPFYKRKAISNFKAELSHLAWTLGAVRDLDVLLENIRAYQATRKPAQQADIQQAVDELDKQRESARHELNEVFDSRLYRRLIKDYSKFLLTSGEGAKVVNEDDIAPVQVRHVLPIIIYHRLAGVRAFDSILPEADAPTLHALRIELKQLRYTLALFSDVLGPQVADFINEVKGLQDCLGHMNDSVIARAYLSDFLKDSHLEALNGYLTSLEEGEIALRGQLTELWAQFNTRKVQQKLSTAILALH
ncbi:MAG: CHAD domain-containing protein [Anaerolineaceae bacterium]|nr:CHAD domain-containing protein [Anaerolineaceae bacterium]